MRNLLFSNGRHSLLRIFPFSFSLSACYNNGFPLISSFFFFASIMIMMYTYEFDEIRDNFKKVSKQVLNWSLNLYLRNSFFSFLFFKWYEKGTIHSSKDDLKDDFLFFLPNILIFSRGDLVSPRFMFPLKIVVHSSKQWKLGHCF